MNREICERRVSEYMNLAAPVISRKTTVHDALRLVRGHGYSALPVCERGRFLGLVGEKDLLEMTPSQATLFSRQEIAALLERVTVGAVVRVPPAAVLQDQSLREAAEAMVRHSTGVLPVLADGRYSGLISWEEILGAALEGPTAFGSGAEATGIAEAFANGETGPACCG